jgi:hypothetical protein
VRGQGEQRDHAGENGIPVKDAGIGAGAEVGPERFDEVAIGSERNAADDISQGSAEKDGEEQTGDAEDEIEEPRPHRIRHVRAQFNADAAQHQQPEHDHERQVEAAEAGGVEPGEGEVERACGSDEPDFVTVPDRADGAHDVAALVGCFGGAKVDHSGAQVEAVEHDVGCHH